jgi:hypothetical protein
LPRVRESTLYVPPSIVTWVYSLRVSRVPTVGALACWLIHCLAVLQVWSTTMLRVRLVESARGLGEASTWVSKDCKSPRRAARFVELASAEVLLMPRVRVN